MTTRVELVGSSFRSDLGLGAVLLCPNPEQYILIHFH